MTSTSTRRLAFLVALLAAGVPLGGRAVAGEDPQPAPSGETGSDPDKGKEKEKPAPCPDCKDGKECEKCAAVKKAAEEEKAKRASAPAFKLKDTSDKEHALADFKGKIVVLEWTNHECPYVKKHYDSGNMQDLQKKYTAKGAAWLSVCSSAEGKQGHMTPKAWNEKGTALKVAATAVLLDADGTAGKAYGAKNTPFMVVVDEEGRIAYRGAIDDNPSAKAADAKGARNHVAEAVDALLAGKAPPLAETKPYG